MTKKTAEDYEKELEQDLSNDADEPSSAEPKEINIDDLESELGRSNSLRILAFIGFFCALIGGGYQFLKPKEKPRIEDILNALSYEAIAMAEDPSGERLYLPSQSNEEVEQYLGNSHGLKFTPRSLSPLPSSWRTDGASIIDYEVAKISAVQYSQSGEDGKIFFFTLNGKLSDLEASEPGILGDFNYQPYASDQYSCMARQRRNPRVATGAPEHIRPRKHSENRYKTNS